MRICCLGDIHYLGNERILLRIAKYYYRICFNSNAVVVVGDITSSGKLEYVREVIGFLKQIIGSKPLLVVPGNHDIYLNDYELRRELNSLDKLEIFNRVVEEEGGIALMSNHYIIDNIGFTGSMGWYDYSFAPQYLGLSREDYKIKMYGLYIWSDKKFVKLPIDDEEFTLVLAKMFEEQIKNIYSSVDKIVAVLHHVPFRELVHYKNVPEWDYFAAFMGAESFSRVIEKYSDKIKLVLYGHSHGSVETRFCKIVHGIKCCNCASPIPITIEL